MTKYLSKESTEAQFAAQITELNCDLLARINDRIEPSLSPADRDDVRDFTLFTMMNSIYDYMGDERHSHGRTTDVPMLEPRRKGGKL